MEESAGRDALAVGEREGARYRLASPRSTPAGLIGQRLGSRAGSSLEFMDHRQYHPGDDIRRIDWSAYARSERLHVKLYRDEVSPHLELLIDTSSSMDLPGSRKGEATLALAAAVARAALNARFTLRAWGVGGVHRTPATCRGRALLMATARFILEARRGGRQFPAAARRHPAAPVGPGAHQRPALRRRSGQRAHTPGQRGRVDDGDPTPGRVRRRAPGPWEPTPGRQRDRAAPRGVRGCRRPKTLRLRPRPPPRAVGPRLPPHGSPPRW